MALTLIIVLFSVSYLIVKAGSFAKNNPGTSMKAAALLKDMFSK